MSSGTQSPPLEATGEHKAMGAGSVDAVAEGKQGQVQEVSDREQRGAYFDNAENATGTGDQIPKQKTD
ncbi:hypothetical protein HWV62_23500 [Athelia sp. TMB]|nr:hypothetical protein HWV62_23500 [Athelia sp. TMB]